MFIIDRRSDPSGKSLANRQRFIRRARALVRQAVREASAGRSIKDIDRGGEISVPAGGVHEPVFRRASEGGVREHVLPGNKEYVTGDRIARPPSGGGGDPRASPDGEGEDAFRFALSNEEFLDLYLEDLELPDLAKRHFEGEEKDKPRRAGYRTSGPASALSIPQTVRKSLARRIALGRPRALEMAALRTRLLELESLGTEPEDASNDPEVIAAARAELERQERRARAIPYIDPVDLRFRRYESQPRPIARAVVFCLMDVSGSMDEHMKDLAKRFFSLLYLFLTRRYRRVEVVFIRHTHEAKEVDEQTFFYSPETGGTVVSTALEEMARIAADRFPAGQWNIYAAQASDGDNMSNDNAKTVDLLNTRILPLCQYYAYLEVGRSAGDVLGGLSSDASTLWQAYEPLVSAGIPMAMRKVRERTDIYPVFRELFERKPAAAR
jgi:uncharacterized sporulation protein YeaH/YhbH (DUF444 family)